MKRLTKVLTLIRGIPGSGKSTVAAAMYHYLPDVEWIEADKFFTTEDGKYDWSADKLTEAHDWCKSEVERCMQQKRENIIVSNTFTTEREVEPYLWLAGHYGYTVQQIFMDVFADSNHDVPQKTVDKMWDRYRQTIINYFK